MEKATNINTIMSYMEKYDFYFKKELGQNFLKDENIARKIVSGLDLKKDDVVIEVGPGLGSLTQIISETAKKVIAVEIDKRASSMLEEILEGKENVQILNKDFLNIDLMQTLNEYITAKNSIKFISNLPYYITSPIIMKVLQSKINFDKIVLLMQKEVANRLNAKINTKDYSSFTLAVNYYADVNILFSVSNSVFYPKPKVDSILLELVQKKNPPVNVRNEEFLFKVIRSAFANRRKTAFNSLSNTLNIDKEAIKLSLRKSGIDEMARAENISIDKFAQLSNILYDNQL